MTSRMLLPLRPRLRLRLCLILGDFGPLRSSILGDMTPRSSLGFASVTPSRAAVYCLFDGVNKQ